MDVKLYNSLTKKKEVLKPVSEDRVGVYSCGPTVYSTPHIGNYRAFLFNDLLVRSLRYAGLEVKHVMNITDVGHLISDADGGEDKMELGARREGRSAWEVAEDYTNQFILHMDKLNIARPDVMPKATDHIDEQIELVQKLEDAGFTYKTSDGIYFDTSKLDDYGSMAGQKIEDKKEGARVEENTEKRNASDFAVWKFSPKDTQRQMEWESPWGVGFPGWHLECTAMSTKYLDELYDIHTGGEDHKPVHHPNEIAQSQAAHGTTESNVWMHNAYLQIDGGKMAKSKGNVYTVDTLEEKGYDPLAFRYLVLTAHYKHPLNFTWDSLEAASIALKKLQTLVRDWDTPAIGSKEHEDRFLAAVSDDVDTPQAIAIVWELVNDASIPTSQKAQSLMKFDSVLGLGLVDLVSRPLVVPDDVQKMLDDRKVARDTKDWDEADRLRLEIHKKGFAVDDTPEGQKLTEI